MQIRISLLSAMISGFWLLLTPLALSSLGCGGATPTVASADDEEDEDDFIDEDEDDEDDEESDSAFVDSTLLHGSGQLALGERTAVPGTGVSLRPIDGSVAMPFSSGFLAMQHRVQITVVVTTGSEEMLEAVRTGGAPNAPEPAGVEPITVSEHRGRLGYDRVRTPQAELERVWLLVHDGERGLGVVATYEAGRGTAFRRVLMESLRSVRWNREEPIDAALALGLEFDPIPGLQVRNNSSANLILLPPNGTFPPSPGDPFVSVSPIPMRVPADRAMGICHRLARQLTHGEIADSEGEISNGQLRGCEQTTTVEDGEGHRMTTYVGLLFSEGTPILVTGTVAADQTRRWTPRFERLARSLRPRPAAAQPEEATQSASESDDDADGAG